MPARVAAFFGSLALVAASLAIGVGVSEAAYRAWLYSNLPERFATPGSDEPLPFFGLYNQSLWEFDPDFGYVYPPGRTVDLTVVNDRRVVGCKRLPSINAQGNIGPLSDNYDRADLKVLVFGDSFTATQDDDGVTWPSLLEERLTERLGTEVSVVNFGRDGYGILQMFDLARAKVAEWEPDLVLLAFITDDLTRDRFWRTVNLVDGQTRVLTTLEPRRHPDPTRAADAFLLHEEASLDWCSRMWESGGRDRVLDEIEDRYRALRARLRSGGFVAAADPLTLNHSYLYHRIRHADPFHFLRMRFTPSQNPRVSYSDYREDAQFVDAVAAVVAAGVPWAIVHLAYLPEIQAGREYIVNDQQQALLDSLEAIAGREVIGVTDFIDLPLERPERITISATDLHPSRDGMALYADAVAEALFANGLIE